MWIKRIRTRNYKSFAESGWVNLGPRFNFVVGKNNSGKTALLETLKLNNAQNMPHRDESIRRDAPTPPNSEFEIEVHLEPNDAFDALQAVGGTFYFPVRPREGFTGTQVVQDVLRNRGVDLCLKYMSGSGPQALGYPSHQLFGPSPNDGPQFVSVTPTDDRRDITLSNAEGGQNDNLHGLFASSYLRAKIFVFEAERIRNGQIAFASVGEILPDASNLPRALFEMQGRPVLWETFNRHVNEILPNVRRVVNVGVGGNIQVHLWPVDPASDRDDLVVKLADSGSGVGQVLAILCAVLTYKSAVICIDEPNNFLHPGAVKALMRILSQYDHQYIISTHSLEAISSVNADTTHMVRWDGGTSTVSKINAASIDENRSLLAELGISLSDVFGVENVLWVEGQTEEICFPMIVQTAIGYMPSTLAIIRVRSVDELVRRQGREGLIKDLYQRLTTAGGLIPRATRFVFDREERSSAYIDNIVRETSGVVSFLPRRTLENYLIDAQALAEELNQELGKQGAAEINAESVADWLQRNFGTYLPPGKAADDGTDIEIVDAPKLLRALFKEVAEVEYRKAHHSPSITRRLLARPDRPLAELIEFVKDKAEV